MQTTRTQHLIATALTGALAVTPSVAQTFRAAEARPLPRGCRCKAPAGNAPLEHRGIGGLFVMGTVLKSPAETLAEVLSCLVHCS